MDLGGFFGGKKSSENDEHSEGKCDSGAVAEMMESMSTLESAQRMGKLTTSILQDLQSSIVEGSAQDGKVKVSFDCQQKPVRVSIDEGYYAEASASEMAASLTLALQDGHAKSIDKMEDKTRTLFSEFGLLPS